MKIIEKIVDLETGEENIIEREETATEKAERKKFEAQVVKEKAAQAEADAKRAAILNKLGITEEEARLLLG